MKKKFDFLMLILTSFCAAIGIGIVGAVNAMLDPDSVMTGVLSSLLFFTVPLLMGYFGLKLALLLKRKQFVQKDSSGSIRALVLALAVSAVLGAVGQLIYAIEWQTYTTEEVIETKVKGSHVVMLMDISGSMQDEQAACQEAACQLIDGLDETTSLQFIAFAGSVEPRNKSGFVTLTPENKVPLQELIRSVNMSGGTNFNQPLEEAVDTLKKNKQQDYRNMIIMLTDGKEPIKESVKASLTDPDNAIDLFTVRITDGSDDSDSDVQALIKLATQDFPVTKNANGTVDVTTVLDTFRAAMNSQSVITKEHKKLAMGSDLIFAANMEDFWWRPIVQVLVFGIYAVLISLAYYGSLGKLSALLSLVSGVACGFLLTTQTEVYAVVLVLLCFGAYTVYEVEEVRQNV